MNANYFNQGCKFHEHFIKGIISCFMSCISVQSEDDKPQSSLPLASFNYINSIIGSGVIGKSSKLYIYYLQRINQ